MKKGICSSNDIILYKGIGLLDVSISFRQSCNIPNFINALRILEKKLIP